LVPGPVKCCKGQQLSDGEEQIRAGFKHRMLVPKSVPCISGKKKRKKIHLDNLASQNNHFRKPLKNHKLTRSLLPIRRGTHCSALPLSHEYPLRMFRANFARFYAPMPLPRISQIHPRESKPFPEPMENEIA